MSDRAIGLGFLTLCVVFWTQTYTIRTPTFAQFEQVNSGFFPRVILGLLALCSLVLLARGSGGLSPVAGVAAVARFARERQRILVSLALFAVYVAVIPILGYVPTTAVFLAAMQLYLRPRGLKGSGLVLVSSAVIAYGLAWFFVSRLNVVLPQGQL